MNTEKAKQLQKGKLYRISETRYSKKYHMHNLYSTVGPDPLRLMGEVREQDVVLFLDSHYDAVYVWCQVLKGDTVGWFISQGIDLVEVKDGTG